MHIQCMGPVNECPTVIIEGGNGCPTQFYHWLQQKLASTVHTCTYDRAGIGWSEDCNEPHDAEHMAAQLHILLNQAGIKGPYVLVGHSIAGLIMRVYASMYPEDIVGIAFLDVSHPRQMEVQEIADVMNRIRPFLRFMKFIASLGLIHVYNPLLKLYRLETLSGDIKRQINRVFNNPTMYKSMLNEIENFEKSAKQVLQAGKLRNIPIVILSASEINLLPAGVDSEKYSLAWKGFQEELTTLSIRSRHKVIEGSDHMSMVTNKKFANQVVDEVLQLVFDCQAENTYVNEYNESGIAVNK